MAEAQGSFIPDNPTTLPGAATGSFVPDTQAGSFLPDEPDTTEMKAFVKENLAKAAEEKKAKGDTSLKPVEAEDWIDAVAAGWAMSTTGLMSRGEMSPIAVPDDAGRIVKIASQVSAIAGDVPAMVVGGVLGGVTGAAAGAAAGTATLPVLGTVGLGAVGAVVGTDFGANALPAAMRKIMMDHYERGDITTADEFFDRLSGTTWEAIKGGTIGVATMGAGRGVAPLAARAGANALTQTATKTAAEIGTMVTASAALEGHMPSADDFTNAAIVVGGLGASVKVAGKLRDRFAKTGQPPAEVLEQISDDVVLRQEINAVNDKTLAPRTPEPPKDLMTTPPSKLAEKWSEHYTKTSEGFQRGLDDLASFKLAKEALAAGKEIPAGADPYLLARNYRGVDMKAWSFENQRTVDFKTGKPNGESLAKIYKDLPNLKEIEISEHEKTVLSRIDSAAQEGKDTTWKKLNAYRVAKRAVELDRRGVETGIDIEAAKKVASESREALEPIVKRVQEYEARALQYAADSGALSNDEVALIKEMNKDYVPFNRLLEADEFDMGGGSKANPLQKIEGSLKQLTDPEQTSRDNVKALIKYAEKNRIYNRLVDLQESAGDGAPEIFRKTDGRTKQLQKNEFRVRREGTGDREVWQVLPEYADALEALNYQPVEAGMLKKFLQLPTKSLRKMTALSPDFIMRNIMRDQFTATVQSKYGQIPFVDALKSIGSIIKKDEAWVSFLESGAFSGGIDNLSPFLDKDLFALNKETGFMDKAWNAIKFPIHALEVASTYAENIPRFSEYRKSGAIGGDLDAQISGAISAREVTVDFQKSGAYARRVMSQWVPFMNVGIQGTDRAFRAFKENPKKTAALAFATITVPSIFTFMNGKDDSRYNDAPSWQKDLFWVLPTDSWEQAASQEDYDSRPGDLKKTGKNGELLVNNGVVWRIPKPFEMGILFGSLPERAMARFYSDDKNAFKQFDNTVTQALIPNIFPTVGVGIGEHLSNHSFFLDSEIVSPHSQQSLPEERYSSYTSETAKQIAKIIGFVPYLRDIGSRATPLNAPAVIDNYLNVWGGTGGKYIVQLSDALLKEFGVSKKAEKPAWTWGDAPFVKAFVTKYPSQKTEPIREFYDRYSTATQAYNSMKKAMEEGDEDRYAEIAGQYEGKMGRLQEVYKMLGSANKVLNNLQNSDVGLDGEKRDPSQRTQLMTTTYFQMNEMAKAALQIMNEMETKK